MKQITEVAFSETSGYTHLSLVGYIKSLQDILDSIPNKAQSTANVTIEAISEYGDYYVYTNIKYSRPQTLEEVEAANKNKEIAKVIKHKRDIMEFNRLKRVLNKEV